MTARYMWIFEGGLATREHSSRTRGYYGARRDVPVGAQVSRTLFWLPGGTVLG